MSITLPEGITLPQEGLLSSLLGGLGTGIATGAQKGVTMGLSQMLAQQKQTQPYDANELMKQAKGWGFKESDFSTDEINNLLNKTNELAKQVGRKTAAQMVFSDTKKYLTDEIDTSGEELIKRGKKGPEQQERTLWKDLYGLLSEPRPEGVKAGRYGPKAEGRTIWSDIGPGSSFSKGLHSGLSGKASAIASGQSLEDYKKESALDDKAGVWDNVLYTVGNLLSDSPGYILGGVIGAPAGPFGAGAMVFAVPKFLNTTLEEFMKHKDKGWNGSFEDYLNSAGKIASESTYAGALGGIFGSVSKLLPVLKASNPAIKEFFETTKYPKIKEFLGQSTLQSMGLVGAEAAAKRELPSKEEVAGTFAQVVGLNLLGLGSNKAKGIIEKVRRSPNPAETISKINESIEKTGIDKEKVASGDKAETNKLYRTVEDITKKYKPKAEIRLPGEKVTKEALEKRAAEPKQKAEKLAKAPLKEYLKERAYEETPAEKAEKLRASKEIVQVDQSIKTVEENVNKLTREIEKGIRSKKSKELIERSKANYEKQLEELKEKRKELEYITKKGRKPFSEAETKELAKKHIRQLEEAARNPEGTSATEWERMFDRDQKYIDQAMEILKRGKEPVEPYKDRYIKTLEAYNDVYRNYIDGVDKAIEAAKGKEKAELQKVKNKLQRNLSINESKLTKQRDKLATKEAIKKGSSLLRHYLRQLKSDLPGMEKPILEYKKIMEGKEEKIAEVAKEKIKSDRVNETLLNELKNEFKEEQPKEEKAKDAAFEEAAEQTNEEPGIYKQWWDKVKEVVKENKGDPLKMLTALRKTYSMLPWKTRIVAAAILNGILKKAKVPNWIRWVAMPSGIIERGIGIYGGSILQGAFDDLQNEIYAQKMRKANPIERKNLRSKLTNKYSNKRINEIIDLSRGRKPEVNESLIKRFLINKLF